MIESFNRVRSRRVEGCAAIEFGVQGVEEICDVVLPEVINSNLERGLLESLRIKVNSPRVSKGKWLKWFAPSYGKLKLHVNGSCNRNIIGYGGVVRAHKGAVKMAFFIPGGRGSPVMDE